MMTDIFRVKMNNIFGLFLILGVFKNWIFCTNVSPVLYKSENEDYAEKLFSSLFKNYEIPNASPPFSAPSTAYQGRLFDGFFNNEISNEARNDTPSTPPPSPSPPITTSKPTAPKPATEVIFIPIYEDPIFDPNYYRVIPPYPMFYNMPIDPRFQFDNFAPFYPVADEFPLAYNLEMQPLAFFKPNPINTQLEKVTLPPFSANVQPTNVKTDSFNADLDRMIVQPVYQNAKPTNSIKPSSINLDTDKTITQTARPNSKVIPNTMNAAATKKILLKPVSENENPTIWGQLTDAGRDELNEQIFELIEDFLIKAQEASEKTIELHTEKTVDETSENSDEYSYKVIEPSSPLVSQTLPYPVPYATSSFSEKQINKVDQSNMIHKLNSTYVLDKIKQGLETDKALPALNSETTQSSVEVNQSNAGTASENGTDDSRKLDTNIGETDETTDQPTDATTDKSSTVSLRDLIKPLKNNQTSANDFKLNDRFTDKSTTLEPKVRTFTDNKGNKCTAKIVTYNGKEYSLYTCEEKSFNGKTELASKTVKPDVTYFIEELPSTTELAPPHVRSTDETFNETTNYETENSTLNTVMYSTNFDELI